MIRSTFNSATLRVIYAKFKRKGVDHSVGEVRERSQREMRMDPAQVRPSTLGYMSSVHPRSSFRNMKRVLKGRARNIEMSAAVGRAHLRAHRGW